MLNHNLIVLGEYIDRLYIFNIISLLNSEEKLTLDIHIFRCNYFSEDLKVYKDLPRGLKKLNVSI